MKPIDKEKFSSILKFLPHCLDFCTPKKLDDAVSLGSGNGETPPSEKNVKYKEEIYIHIKRPFEIHEGEFTKLEPLK